MTITNYINKLSTLYDFEYEHIIEEHLSLNLISFNNNQTKDILRIDYHLNDTNTIRFTFKRHDSLSTILKSIDLIELFHMYLTEGNFLEQELKETLNLKIQEHMTYKLKPILDTKIFSEKETDHFKAEQFLFLQITEGNRERLIIEHSKFFNNYSIGLLSKKNIINNKKYFIVSSITLATRASIQGGVPQRIAYSLSDLFIQELDTMHHDFNEQSVSLNIALAFCDEVIKHKKRDYSPLVLDIQNYININLYKNIRLNELAEAVNYSANYISKIFKDETKQTVSEYINMIKIKEAKQLIIYSTLSLSEIASQLNFTDYSHFSKVFKKQEGITPYEYETSLN